MLNFRVSVAGETGFEMLSEVQDDEPAKSH